MLAHLGRSLRAPLNGLSLRPLIVLSIIVYLFAIVCIGQLRHQGAEKQRIGPPGVDASPVHSDDRQEEGDGKGDEDEDDLAGVTRQLVKRSEIQDPSKVRGFAGPSNLIGGRRPGDDEDDDEEEDDDDTTGDDRDDENDDDDERRGQAEKQKSTGGSAGQTQASQPAPTSLLNRLMNFGGFGRAAGGSGAGEQPSNGPEKERARLFKLGLIIGR